MKYLAILMLLCTSMLSASAQKLIEKKMAYQPTKDIRLNIPIADSIKIITWNKNEVYAWASVDINDNKDNDNYRTRFENNDHTITIDAKFSGKKKILHLRQHKSRIYWVIYLPEQSSFSVETINGNITIHGNTKGIKAHTISGFIDMDFRSFRRADLKMSTITGTIYTDLALNQNRNDSGTNHIFIAYNGGGPAVQLETISGNIFLRKIRQKGKAEKIQ